MKTAKIAYFREIIGETNSHRSENVNFFSKFKQIFKALYFR
jgi:hypothetical protein